MSKVQGAESSSTPPKPRFSWPMRFFLGFLLFDIVFHSFAALAPYRDWLEEMDLARFPKRLPTWQELQDMKEGELTDKLLASADSVWEYFKPWPEKRVRDKLTTFEDHGMYALSWMTSRLDLFENLVGAPQRWTMFSPNASTEATVARFRLVYKDKEQKIVRITGDPEDLTNYTHWFEEKVLDAELKVPYDYDARVGYCNYLAHQHARNQAGSPLYKIYIYKVTYRYPAPGEDIRKAFVDQSGPPFWDRGGPQWCYNVADRTIKKLKNDERLETQRMLDKYGK
ncbi:MAG: hypothetical protein L0Y72_01355 [Gemmataceae bacterium]|nr:hypothetical protein [Gemmataceae bacterium]MCI0737660.1 hypothetical protein [Gemmataceae bacterium]